MNPLTLAEEIINGRRITREDDLSFFLTCDLDELCEGADRIRAACLRYMLHGYGQHLRIIHPDHR